MEGGPAVVLWQTVQSIGVSTGVYLHAAAHTYVSTCVCAEVPEGGKHHIMDVGLCGGVCVCTDVSGEDRLKTNGNAPQGLRGALSSAKRRGLPWTAGSARGAGHAQAHRRPGGYGTAASKPILKEADLYVDRSAGESICIPGSRPVRCALYRVQPALTPGVL